jgi:membrane associated rhomboid family serine protease
MFPIRDHNPSDRRPYVTWALIAINVVVFLSYYPSLSGNERLLMSFFDDWALVPIEAVNGKDGHTLLTSMFLHGGWMHLIGNMLFLYIFGDNHGGPAGASGVPGVLHRLRPRRRGGADPRRSQLHRSRWSAPRARSPA